MTSDYFNYRLPPERIAQRPAGLAAARDSAKLLRAVRALQPEMLQISTHRFSELSELLRRGDLLVLNDSRVRPCRFFVRLPGALSESEVFLLEPRDDGRSEPGVEHWSAIAKPMKRFRVGTEFNLCRWQGEAVNATVVERSDAGDRLELQLRREPAADGFGATDAEGDDGSCRFVLEQTGTMPIPPYIRGGRADASDRELYQTVYARGCDGGALSGSVAAPTAGLHFTPPLLERLAEAGTQHCFVSLDVGFASITPVKVDALSAHRMASEKFSISAETAKRILAAKQEGRRIIAVGTTCVRALEAGLGRALESGPEYDFGEADLTAATDIFITPGYRFRVIDALITNFHQPRSTHLLLVAAFFGEAGIKAVYDAALAGEMRFLSYGDSMLLEFAGG